MKILIVDDEPLIRRSLVRAFQASGHHVFEAADGIEGLRVWQAELPDAVLLDVLMPGLTGPQVLDKIPLSIKTRTKIIVMSAFTGDFSEQMKGKKDFDLFLPKPFDDIFQIVKLTEELKKQDL